MKLLARLLSLAVLVSAVILFSRCDGGDDPKKSEQQIQFEKLKFTWTLQEARLNNQTTGNAAEEFNDASMTLVISGNFAENGKFDYTWTTDTEIAASPWPESGKWQFGSPVTSQIIRLDSETISGEPNVDMSYALSNSDKTLSVTIDDYDGNNFVIGRTASVDGTWSFTFTRP